jgi:hypothetical protein
MSREIRSRREVHFPSLIEIWLAFSDDNGHILLSGSRKQGKNWFDDQERDSPMFKNYSSVRFLTRFLTG